jgi:predicted HTH domain antitoxin
MTDDMTRETLLRLLARGVITMTEAAHYAGVRVQTVDDWCRARGIKAVQRRQAYVLAQCRRALKQRAKAEERHGEGE